VGDAETLELGSGVLHGIPVRIAAHHDADQGLRHLCLGDRVAVPRLGV